MREIGHFIGGKHVAGKSGRTADVYNPATGEVQAKVALASDAELAGAVEVAKAAQPAWAATNPQRRARVFMKFVQLLNDNMNELAEMLSKEHGKTIEDAKARDLPASAGWRDVHVRLTGPAQTEVADAFDRLVV